MRTYYLIQVELTVYPEGYLPQQALIHHHPHIPQVDFLIVLLALHYFGRVIQWAA